VKPLYVVFGALEGIFSPPVYQNMNLKGIIEPVQSGEESKHSSIKDHLHKNLGMNKTSKQNKQHMQSGETVAHKLASVSITAKIKQKKWKQYF
jgi:hypothetical protein